MAELSVQTIDRIAGTVVSMSAAAGGGDSFKNTGATYMRIANGSGGAITITADCPNPDNFGVTGAALDLAISVAAGATKVWGPFDPKRFNDANGLVQLTYSGVTSLTVAAVQGMV
jgi:hypothetical protein